MLPAVVLSDNDGLIWGTAGLIDVGILGCRGANTGTGDSKGTGAFERGTIRGVRGSICAVGLCWAGLHSCGICNLCIWKYSHFIKTAFTIITQAIYLKVLCVILADATLVLLVYLLVT